MFSFRLHERKSTLEQALQEVFDRQKGILSTNVSAVHFLSLSWGRSSTRFTRPDVCLLFCRRFDPLPYLRTFI